jgi:biopolymer transport protein ExbD
MSMASNWELADEGAEQGLRMVRRGLADDTDMDITPMIDVTFLLLIFFLYTSVPDAQSAVEKPPARLGEAVDPRSAVVLTMVPDRSPDITLLYLSEQRGGEGDSRPLRLTEAPLAGEEVAAIRNYIRQAREQQHKTFVLLNAERRVIYRDIVRIREIAHEEGLEVRNAVQESD